MYVKNSGRDSSDEPRNPAQKTRDTGSASPPRRRWRRQSARDIMAIATLIEDKGRFDRMSEKDLRKLYGLLRKYAKSFTSWTKVIECRYGDILEQ